MTAKKLPPVRKSITVHATPKRAFDVFTREMNRWWPAEFTPFPRDSIVIEPKRDGRWFETGAGGEVGNTGKVLDWQARRSVCCWHGRSTERGNMIRISFTELEICFTSDGNGSTRVDVEHRDFERMGELAEQTRAMIDSDEGWSGLLKRFADAVKAG